ncbi:MAG: hypothetical protein Ct9H90mP16_12870 [Candidatus Poseidoniales archaeon]|nr:MAG: hypothetical protein Ct9H90mP16_12870 [Candidatus Poseidoniales archaeon]
MSWGVFGITGAVAILIVAELLEGIIPYGGVASALVVGVPLTVMRKPIYNTINIIVVILMPKPSPRKNRAISRPIRWLWMMEFSLKTSGSYWPFQAKKSRIG